MAHRALFVSFILFCLTPLLTAQQEDEPWFSLTRLTFSASGSYTFAPWTKYNESMHKVQDAIQYNPAYPNPQGSLEVIKGDLDFQLEARYWVFGPVFLILNAGRFQTEGIIDYHQTTPYSWSYWQTMWLHSYHYGVGIGFEYTIDEQLSCSASVLASNFPARLDFQAASNSLPSYSYLFDANLKESALGVDARLETALHVTERLKATAHINYRWLTLKNLSGTGSETSVYYSPYIDTQINGPNPFVAQFGEAEDYVGLYVPAQNGISFHLLHLLWARATSGMWWNSQHPATLNLSGFGFGVGVSYEF